MDDFLAAVGVLAIFGVMLGGLAWIAARVRRRRIGGGLMGPFEEIWHPNAHRARVEIEIQDERLAPGLPPAGPDDAGRGMRRRSDPAAG